MTDDMTMREAFMAAIQDKPQSRKPGQTVTIIGARPADGVQEDDAAETPGPKAAG